MLRLVPQSPVPASPAQRCCPHLASASTSLGKHLQHHGPYLPFPYERISGERALLFKFFMLLEWHSTGIGMARMSLGS